MRLAGFALGMTLAALLSGRALADPPLSATQLVAAGRFDEAVAQYRQAPAPELLAAMLQAAAGTRTQPRRLLTLTRAFERAELPAEALTVVSAYAESRPLDAEAYVAVATTAARLDQPQAAAAAYRKAIGLARTPLQRWTWSLTAARHESAIQPRAAGALIAPALSAADLPAELRLAIIQLLAEIKLHSGRLECLPELLARAAASEQAVADLTSLYAATGDRQGAAQLALMLAGQQITLANCQRLTRALLAPPDVAPDAETTLQACLTAFPREFGLVDDVAACLSRLGQHEAALALNDKLLKDTGRRRSVLDRRVELLQAAGRADEAAALATTISTELSAEDRPDWLLRAAYRAANTGNAEEARRLLDKLPQARLTEPQQWLADVLRLRLEE